MNKRNPILDSQTKKIKDLKKKFIEKKSIFIPNNNTMINNKLVTSKKIKIFI